MEQEEAREKNTQIQLAVAAPQPQQKCPRCDSMNTKFCYFNNYSLSQPRHYCKTCKRYWTHGGTFRNIPVGGGSRKAKRGKTYSSSSSNSLAQPQSNLMSSSPPLNVVQSTSPYSQLGGGGGRGYLYSLTPSQPFNQHLNSVAVSSSNLPLVSGFNAASFLPPRFHHLGIRERVESVYPARQRLVPSNIASSSDASHYARRPQSLINNVSSADHMASSDASLWSATVNATSISGNSDQNNVKGGSSSLIPNHWLHLPGYRPPQ